MVDLAAALFQHLVERRGLVHGPREAVENEALFAVGFLEAVVDDADDDGPSAHDPAGLISIDISDSNLDDIDIQLSDEPDLGALTPGDSPPPTEIPADDPAPQAKAEIKVQVEAHDDASEPKALPETSATE